MHRPRPTARGHGDRRGGSGRQGQVWGPVSLARWTRTSVGACHRAMWLLLPDGQSHGDSVASVSSLPCPQTV